MLAFLTLFFPLALFLVIGALMTEDRLTVERILFLGFTLLMVQIGFIGTRLILLMESQSGLNREAARLRQKRS